MPIEVQLLNKKNKIYRNMTIMKRLSIFIQ